MNPKGLKRIELLADKAVLGVFALLFLLVTASQFVGSNANVKIGNDDVGVERAYKQIVNTANSLQAQMNIPDIDPRVPAASVDLADRLEKALASAPIPPVAVALGRPFEVESTGAAVAGDSGSYELPQPPSPSMPVAKVFGGALDPYVLQAHPELKAALLGDPDRQPYDLFAISVQAEFDARDYRRLLEADPDGAGELSSIPRQWWRNRLEVLDVRVSRREVFPDGSYGAETLLPPLPGVASLRDRLVGDYIVGEFNSLVRESSQSAGMIRQPLFFNLIAGEPWAPPMDSVESAPSDARAIQLRNLRRDIAELGKKIDQLRKVTLLDVSNPIFYAAARQPVSPGNRSSSPGKSKKVDKKKRQQQAKARIAELTAQLDSLQKQETTLIASMRADGVNPETGQKVTPERIFFAPPPRLQDEDEITVWAHDVHIEPGASYQYRVELVFPNPLMGYQQSMAPEMNSLGEIATLTTEPSQWSEPVSTPKLEYMFIDRATPQAPADAVGDHRAVATVDLYRFFYGYWRKGQTRVHAGDVIGDQIGLESPLPIWDLSGGAPVQTEEFTDPVPAITDLFLLDVVTEPAPGEVGPGGHATTRQAAIIGSAAGAVTVRRPDVDASSPLRQVLETSVKAGLSAQLRTPIKDVKRRAPREQAAGQTPSKPDRPARNTPAPQHRGLGGGLGGPG